MWCDVVTATVRQNLGEDESREHPHTTQHLDSHSFKEYKFPMYESIHWDLTKLCTSLGHTEFCIIYRILQGGKTVEMGAKIYPGILVGMVDGTGLAVSIEAMIRLYH